ncbi:BIR protein [Plasmodium berghei]|uniref:BIR protein n=2 Tax=Plasmodium berghei TaxID=5821 RepID=A0A509AVY1_PLABA|nr:BIR protein [Plasmodium berghei ANKA]CXH20593.1 BIR protein [Plasmodium berghei]VUC58723.1 BIR protein [Plasmodium berghei ANKA]|eukprot:XP_034424485.1 BIR protein [Plasmodium berghei ANKA]
MNVRVYYTLLFALQIKRVKRDNVRQMVIKLVLNFSDHHIRNLYKLLNELCTLITKYNQDRSIPEAYLEYANKCAETYKNLVTKVSAVKNYDSYCDVLSTLKSEYDKFKEENKDPECQLPEFDGIESCKDLCKQKKQKAEIDNNSGDGLVDGKVYIDGGSDDNQRNYEESRSGQGATNSVPGENDAQNTPGITFDIGRSVFTSVLNRTFNFAETYKEKIINISKGIPGVYNKTLNNIKNGFSKSINFFNEIIGSIRSSSKKVEISGDSGDKRHGLEGTRDKSPTSNDSPSPQETPSKTSSPSSSTEQTKTSESSQGPSEKKNCDKKSQEPQAPVPKSVFKLKNPITEVTGNGTKGIDVNILKRYKPIGVSIIMFLIPITLLILYKYFSFGWRKELKKKKNMKKVINMFGVNEATKRVINTTDRKKQVQIIINSSTQKKQNKKFTNSSTQKKQDERLTNSSTQKKQDERLTNSSTQKKQDERLTNSSTQKKQDERLTNSSTQKKQDEKLTNLSTQKKRNKKLKNSSTQKKQDERLTNSSTQKKKTKQFINSIYWEKYPLLNIHKLMKTDSVPFVILFLFIFYVYKKKGYCLE